MANQQYRKKGIGKKDTRNGISRSYQVENDSKKTAPQHAFEGKHQDLWWQSSLQHEECPITLEPFATLPYPPFSLPGDVYHRGTNSSISSNLSTNKNYYFDGFALASYLVARGIFENPLTRQALTMDDCRRLDEYLEIYRKKHESSPMEHDSRAVSVAEAFSLQQSIQVEKTSSSSNQRSQEEARAQVLRRTATAALAGLFDYSRPNQHRRQTQRHCGNQISEGATTRNQDPRLAEWGLDLSRTVENSSSQNDTGWTIIDDNEELVTAAQRDAYEFVQQQFPRLSDRKIEGTAVHKYDESIIQTARSVALREERLKQRHTEAIAHAQQRLGAMALRQQEERKKQQKEEWQQGHVQWEQQQREKEELMRARQEIDAWREEQWETLRQISEEQTRGQKGEDHEKKDSDLKLEDEDTGASPPGTSTSPQDHDIAIEDAKSSKKAKAAAKRKRAKARKQAQKAAAKAALEEKQKEEDLVAKKAASAKKCAACGGGMLDAGFEKFGLKFCSTKCARTAKPPDR